MIDFGALFAQLFSTNWWLLPLIVFAALLKSAWFKGMMGEAMVNMAARLFLNNNDYHLIKNVTIPTEDGTTQIDHIIVSRFGVFVVETKNMKGWIFGSANQKQWTQQIYKSKHTTRTRCIKTTNTPKRWKTCSNSIQPSSFPWSYLLATANSKPRCRRMSPLAAAISATSNQKRKSC